ncbi:Uncharacterized conserved protein YjdB, contains Ig-like domain [Pilibacter termitis]|uniref:Uncharacterized conserved protein YjdB, contains Ig-like domain n=1 Tax=Pilibacter termitis TaxID=263852 RepID=A0A1T4PXP0_9ENTE|nr:GBS Bsp-like repeat-containing protein [Pilibacter termitis]SJZ96259.1 Uncharacterized conserved protein YjdB, contains Ig-like domain [Pilibacter termitis]
MKRIQLSLLLSIILLSTPLYTSALGNTRSSAVNSSVTTTTSSTSTGSTTTTDPTTFSTSESVEETSTTTSETTSTTSKATDTTTTTQAPAKTEKSNITMPQIFYKTFVEKSGWTTPVKNGELAGTNGQSKRIEAINAEIESTDLTGTLEYASYVQEKGWLPFVQQKENSGTPNSNLQIEAVKMRLTGELAEKYDIAYRVHVQNFGWLDWTGNGEISGSLGFSHRVEAIEIKLLTKGKLKIGKRSFIDLKTIPKIQYEAHVQNIGWQAPVYDGEVAGTFGQSKRMEALRIRLLETNLTGDIEYTTHVQNKGWLPYSKNGQQSGTTGNSLRIEALQVNLTGELGKYYDVVYRVHSQNFGWLAWTKNNEPAGTGGCSLRAEAIEIKIVKKGTVQTGGKSFIDGFLTPVYRMYDPKTKHHFFTQNNDERSNVYYFLSFENEGVRWASQSTGEVAVYRLLNLTTMEHMYTANEKEKNSLVKSGWKYEGIAFRAVKKGKPIYRAYDVKNNTHHWAEWAEIKGLIKAGWKNEGIAFYVPEEKVNGESLKKPQLPTAKLQTTYLGTGNVKLSVTNLPSGAYDIQLPTWSNVNGQDDLVWYKGNNVIVNGRSHRSTGNYTTHMYISVGRLKKVYVGSGNFSLKQLNYKPKVYFSQLDSRWRNNRVGLSTVGSSGCVPTSLSMAFSAFGIKTDPYMMALFLNRHTSYNNSIFGCAGDAAMKGIQLKGLKSELAWNKNQLVDQLKMGRPVLALLAPPFVEQGYTHGVLLYGYTNGKTQIYDPYDNRNSGMWSVDYIWQHQSYDKDDRNLGSVFLAIRD